MLASGFLLAIFVAFLAYFIAKLLKLPELALLLLAAALCGPHGLNLVSQEEIETFSSIGAMLLLYTIGLEFKASQIKRYGTTGFIFAFSKILLVALPIAILSIYVFVIPTIESFLLGLSLSITSTAIFAELTRKMGIFRTKEAKQLFAELVWEDVFAVFFLILATALVKGENIEYSFLLSLAYFLIPYLVVKKVSGWLVHNLPRDKEVYFLFSLAIAAVMIMISALLGVPEEIAAFLAGSIAANYREVDVIRKNLRLLSFVFLLFFFFSLGMEANLMAFLDLRLLGFALLVLFINGLFKVFSSSMISLALGGTTRNAALSGLLMISVGEFSLLIAKESAALFPQFDIVSVVSGVVFLSSIISWYIPKLLPFYSSFISQISMKLSAMRRREIRASFFLSYQLHKYADARRIKRFVRLAEPWAILFLLFSLSYFHNPTLHYPQVVFLLLSLTSLFFIIKAWVFSK